MICQKIVKDIRQPVDIIVLQTQRTEQRIGSLISKKRSDVVDLLADCTSLEAKAVQVVPRWVLQLERRLDHDELVHNIEDHLKRILLGLFGDV